MIKVVLRIRGRLADFVSIVGSITKVLLLSKQPGKEKKASSDFNEVVILGNGPSLITMIEKHAEFLKGKDLVCVNHFPSTDEYVKLKPKYLISAAQDLYCDDVEDFFIEQSNRLFNDIANRTTWPLIVYFPFDAKKFSRWQSILADNRNITLRFYNTTPVEGSKGIRHILFNLRLGMARPHNVLIPSMFLMIWLGYRKIYLWGADHSWLKDISVDEQNNALINQKHFYDEHTSVARPLDWKGVGARKLHEILYKFMTAFASYFVIDEYAKSRNVSIINKTKGSFIDAFEREN